MNAPKVTDIDYIQFLIAAQRIYTCTEAARCATNASTEAVLCATHASHDAYTRLLARLPSDTAALWRQVEPLVHETTGLLIGDDTTLDKPYAFGQTLRFWTNPALRRQLK